MGQQGREGRAGRNPEVTQASTRYTLLRQIKILEMQPRGLVLSPHVYGGRRPQRRRRTPRWRRRPPAPTLLPPRRPRPTPEAERSLEVTLSRRPAEQTSPAQRLPSLSRRILAGRSPEEHCLAGVLSLDALGVDYDGHALLQSTDKTGADSQ